MRTEHAKAPGPSSAPLVELRTIWHVEADRSYDVTRPPAFRAGHGLIIRTVAGRGRIRLDDGEMTTEPGQVLMLDQGLLRRYRCDGGHWHFWWFDCRNHLFDDWRLVGCRWSPEEEADHRRALRALRSVDDHRRALAAALVGAWLARWRLEASGATDPGDAGIDAAVDAMHEHPDGSLAITDLARIAGLGERQFRNRFRERCACPPKRYYLSLRLDLARELIRHQGLSVEATAERLGFSSAFHLSRSYRQHYGHPPSQA